MEKKFSNLDIVWLMFINISIIFVSYISKSGVMQAILSICGINYVFLVGKEIRFSHILGAIYTSLYAIVLWKEGLYGNALYNIIYCVPVIIYAYIIWGVKKDKNSLEPMVVISKLKSIKRLLLFVLLMLVTALYTSIAKEIGINFVLVDAINIIFGFTGMFLLAKKHIEQWFCFIIINVTNLVFWWMQSIGNISNITLLCLWAILLANNIYGYVSWNSMLKQQNK